MGEILGIGMSHYPGMRAAMGAGTNITRVLQRPDIPADWKDSKNWPPEMQKQWSNDEGMAHSIEHREEFIKQCKIAREALDRFKPDFVLCWGDDQYENFKEDIIPSFCVLAYDDMDIHPYHPERDRLDPNAAVSALAAPIDQAPPPNAWGESPDTVMHIKGKRDAAKYLTRSLINQGIDTAYAYQPLHFEGLAHAFLNTVMFLDWERKGFEYPYVSMQVNCYGSHVIVNRGGAFPVGRVNIPEGDLDPPGPTPKRCMEVGAAVVRALKESPWRVAIIASSSWSHAFLVPKNYFVHPDVVADRKMYEALIHGDYDTWRNVSNTTVEESGWQELRNWWCLVGAMEELGHKAPAHHTFLESWLMNSNKTFALYDPA